VEESVYLLRARRCDSSDLDRSVLDLLKKPQYASCELIDAFFGSSYLSLCLIQAVPIAFFIFFLVATVEARVKLDAIEC